MFGVKGNAIIITSGDTGILTYVPRSSRTFTDADRAVFTAKTRTGAKLVELTLTPAADGTVQIPFVHETTENWEPGLHEWDLRYVVDAVFTGTRVTGGREVSTPMEVGVLDVRRAVGTL